MRLEQRCEVALGPDKNALGLIHVYTGHGKGKTTAAFGLIVRALGRGKNAKVIQFFKNDTGEKNFLSPYLGVQYSQFLHKHPMFDPKVSEKALALAVKAFWEEETKDLFASGYDIVLLDELQAVTRLLGEERVLAFLRDKPAKTEVLITGRDIAKSIIDASHYCTRMEEVKHPYNDLRLPAREGIEY